MSSFVRLSALALALMLSLTACNKDEPAASESLKANIPKAEVVDNLDNSPTVKVFADIFKETTTAMASAIADKATQEQLDCLANPDETIFIEAGKTEVRKMLDDEMIKESDKFYGTEAGQKMLKFIKQQIQIEMQDKPIEGELVTITEEDKAKIAEFNESEVGKKWAQATSENMMSSKELLQLITGLTYKELDRCHIR